QLVGDALRADPQRARGDHLDLGLAETGRPAVGRDPRRPRALRDDIARAGPRPVLELREREHVGDALLHGLAEPGRPADLPQSPTDTAQPRTLRLRKR